jgi:hypothetical protein
VTVPVVVCQLKSTFMNLAGLDGCGTVPAKDIVSTMYEEFQAEVEAERVLAGKRSVLGLFIVRVTAYPRSGAAVRTIVDLI